MQGRSYRVESPCTSHLVHAHTLNELIVTLFTAHIPPSVERKATNDSQIGEQIERGDPSYSPISVAMIPRKAPTSLLTFLSPSTTSYVCRQCRHLHKHVPAGKIPEPTPFVPDTNTFLTLIGRELSKHASKFSSWQDLFTLSSPQLREMGIEPARTRRYLLHWRERFRKGEFGIGGDLKHVKDGVAELRVVELPSLEKSTSMVENESSPNVSTSQNPGKTKLILNLPQGTESYELEPGQTTEDLKKPQGFKLHRGHAIVGPYVQPLKGTNGCVATLKVQEGLWEHRRGHKVDGGERRKAEVRFKRGVAERKAQRS